MFFYHLSCILTQYENEIFVISKWQKPILRPHWSDVKGKVEQKQEMFKDPPGWTMCGDWYVQERRYIHVCMFVCMCGLGMSGADPGGGMGGSCPPPLSKWSITSCAYNCQPLLCFSLANTHTSRMI